ncbi:MAG: substrate-binding domain-containing protein [Lentisphaeria bacterium]
MPAKRWKIGLYLPPGPAHYSKVFSGVGVYCRGRHQWTILNWPNLTQPADAELEQELQANEIDGAIVMGTPGWESLVLAGRVRAVSVRNAGDFPGLPRVGGDSGAIGRLAAQHFRERGLWHLAAVGERGSLPSAQRLAAFTEAALDWCPQPVHQHLLAGPAALTRWLRGLPRPVGIFCWNDEAAKYVHSACEALDLKIPHDAAILGADNDEAICHVLDPALSSIDPNAQRIGYEAAALLDRLLAGETAPREPLLIPPIGLVTRASTDMLAIDAPDVVKAVRFIGDYANGSLQIKDLMKHLAVSRSSLERQFRTALGRSPRSEITRVVVHRAQDLLAHTDLAIPTIAERCGYARHNNFTAMFRKQTGQTPTAYRRQTRLM